ncbi:hypothetical protein D3C85_906270 [compost metagenome]
MQGKAEHFAQVVRNLGLLPDNGSIENLPLPDDSLQTLENASLDIVSSLEERYPTQRLVFNATGGTKLMSLLFMRACEYAGERWEALYLDTEHESLIWLQPQGRPAETVPAVLDATQCLKAQGFTRRRTMSDDADWCKRVLARRSMTLWLGNHAKDLDWLIGTLNKTLREVQPVPHGAVTLCADVNYKLAREAMQRLHEANLIDLVPDSTPASFYLRQADSLDYLTGQWLEEFVWLSLREAGLTEVHCGLNQTDDIKPSRDIRNELDVVAMHQNRLLVIECKTAHLGSEADYNKVLTLLDSLSDRSSGTFGQRWLVLARLPRSGRDEPEREASLDRMRLRARSMRIELIEPEHLPRLTELSSQWKQNMRLQLS